MFLGLNLITNLPKWNVTSWSLIVSVTITYSWLSVCFIKLIMSMFMSDLSSKLDKTQTSLKAAQEKVVELQEILTTKEILLFRMTFWKNLHALIFEKFNQNLNIKMCIWFILLMVYEKKILGNFLKQNCRRKWLRTC